MNDLFLNGQTPDWVNDLPREFHTLFWGVQVWQWVGLLFLAVIARISMGLGRWVAVRLMRSRERFRPGEITQETHLATRRAGGLLAGVLICFPLVAPLALPPRLEHAVISVLEAMTILAVGMLTYALWDAMCDTMANKAAGVSERAERLLVPLTRKFVRAIIVVVGLFVAMSTLFNVNISAVVASLGIGGLIVALAGKDSVENIFGSVTILFDMPFAIGDRVTINTTDGVVEEINLRSTRIRTFEDSLVTLPNANLIRSTVENWSVRRYRRQKINVRVAFQTPPKNIEAICSELRKFLQAQANVDPSRIIVNLHDMDDTGLLILVQCYLGTPTEAEEMTLRHKIIAEIARLRAKNIPDG